VILRRDPLANPGELIERVYGYVAYRIGHGPDAEDVTSEVFERALRYRKHYDSSKGTPTAWLIGIARRCVADAVRPAAHPAVHEIPPSRELEPDTVARLSLASALAQLPARDRELIALRFGADLTARQVAAVVGTRTNAVEVALHRSLARLRNILQTQGNGPNEAPNAVQVVRI
jgi:RNA polymerase sigma-70 factor (ECF subfamily)